MNFRTRIDFTNRQAKQYEKTDVSLSGKSTFGLPYSALTSGPDLDMSGVTFNNSTLVSTFFTNTGTTTYTFGDSRMTLAEGDLSAITPSNSGTTQFAGPTFEGYNVFTTVDGYTGYTSYSGVSYDVTVQSMVSLGGGAYSGVIQSDLSALSASSLDWTGSTIWADVSGVTRTNEIIITKGATNGYVLTSDSEGRGSWIPSNSATTFNLDYIDFNTGATTPAPLSGRLYYDNVSNALAYFTDDTNTNIQIGRQLYTRVVNNSGSLIPKGSAVKIQSAVGSLPDITLAIASASTEQNQVVGLASDDIPDTDIGYIINSGVLSGLTTNAFNVGDIIYLSDTVAGGYVSSTDSLEFSSRSNQIGYVLKTGTTTGEIYVDINNEDFNLTLTDKERNVLEGNTLSTGVYSYTGMTKTSSTTFDIAPARGWIVANTNQNATKPDVDNLFYSGATGLTTPFLATSDSTFVLLNTGETITYQTTEPTPIERRENILLGKIVHPDRTQILTINDNVDYDVSPMSALRDLFTPIKLINDGITVSPNGANLNFNTSSGFLWGNGINWVNNELDPNRVSISGNSPTTFQYKTQTGGTFSNTTVIDAANYDVGGTVTPVPGTGDFTTQRIYLFPSGIIRVQYGQTVYPTLVKALAGIPSEVFNLYQSHDDDAILIGLLTVADNATDLSDPTEAIFSNVSKFGESSGGAAGLSTITLQQAYNNSVNPEIQTNATLTSVDFRVGSGSDTDAIVTFENTTGGTRGAINGEGSLSLGHGTPSEKLDVLGSIKMVDGNEANGYVLTSDASGVGSWQAVSGGSTTFWSGGTGTNAITAKNHNSTASANDAVSWGDNATASGVGSTAFGNGTVATGEYSVAYGFGTSGNSFTAHAEGTNTLANSSAAHAEGSSTVASGNASHAEGNNTTASGLAAHAEGRDTTASGPHSHAGGRDSTASGERSFIHSYLSNVESNDSAILAGTGNTITSAATRSAIIGGSGITGDSVDTVYVPDLVIDGLTSTDPIATDADGRIVAGTSDARLKTNVEDLSSALDVVKKLRGVSYEWTEESKMGAGVTKFGLIAQEVKDVIPKMVRERSKGDGMLTLSYTELVPWLIEAVKELGKPIENIKSGESEIKTDNFGRWIATPALSSKHMILPVFTPTSSNDERGMLGDATWDDDHIYIKTNKGWKRSSLENF